MSLHQKSILIQLLSFVLLFLVFSFIIIITFIILIFFIYIFKILRQIYIQMYSFNYLGCVPLTTSRLTKSGWFSLQFHPFSVHTPLESMKLLYLLLVSLTVMNGIHTWPLNIYVHMYECVYVYVYVHMCICIYIYYVCMCMFVCVFIYIHIYICIDTFSFVRGLSLSSQIVVHSVLFILS